MQGLPVLISGLNQEEFDRVVLIVNNACPNLECRNASLNLTV